MNIKSEQLSKEDESQELEQAKDRLRDALTKLESIVETRVTQANDNGEPNGDTQERIQNLFDENKHLKEENQGFRTQIGKEQAKIKSLAQTNTQAVERIDSLILEIKQVLNEKR